MNARAAAPQGPKPIEEHRGPNRKARRARASDLRRIKRHVGKLIKSLRADRMAGVAPQILSPKGP